MSQAHFIVGFGGTTRAGSSSERMVAAVLKELESQGAETRLFGGEFLAGLPHYAPENPQRTAAQSEFVEAIRRADGIVIGSAAWHGGVSGLVKNAIDLIGDLQEDRRVFLQGRAVGLVVTAGGWQAAGTTLSAMRDIVHALRGWPTPAGVAVKSEPTHFAADGSLADATILRTVQAQARQILALSAAGVYV